MVEVELPIDLLCFATFVYCHTYPVVVSGAKMGGDIYTKKQVSEGDLVLGVMHIVLLLVLTRKHFQMWVYKARFFKRIYQ